MISILTGDCREMLKTLESESVHCVVTSPPYYGLRDYGVDDQLGLESTPAEYIANLVTVFRDVRRVMRRDATLWLNIGDSYNNRAVSRPSSHQGGLGFRNESIDTSWRDHAANGRAHLSITSGGLKEKDLIGIPWMLAFALRDDGWYLRSDIIWSKPNPMPESVTDRPTKAHEYLFLLTRSAKYYYDADAIREPAMPGTAARYAAGYNTSTYGRYQQRSPTDRRTGANDEEATPLLPESASSRNKRSVWEIATEPFPEAHFATYPTALVEPCIKAGCPVGGTVLDPFAGAGTTLLVADRLERDAIGIELNPTYAEMARRRIYNDGPMFAQVAD